MFVPPFFERHAQPVGETVDVAVVCDDQIQIENVPIAQAGCAQRIEIAATQLPGRARELGGVIKQRAHARTQIGLSVILLQLFDQHLVLDQAQETPAVMPDSIIALIRR
jgi:hypothetical protein